MRKQRWAVIVAHRRCGKTVACVNDIIARALNNKRQFPRGRYAYVAPYYTQAKEAVWDYLKHFAGPATTNKNESELWVELGNGAQIRIHGADNPDRLRGTYLDGVILDEYAQMRPSVWGEVIGPMLADYKGWATFIGTPKGHNEFFDIYQDAQTSPDWFHTMLKASETRVLPEDELATWRAKQTPEQYAQEFECSFEAAIAGAYFGREMAEAERTGRITAVPYDENAKVYTAWDLGKGANMAVWCWQAVGSEIHVIDYVEGQHSDGIPHLDKALRDKPYPISADWLPHDAKATEIGSGRTRIETMVELKRHPQIVWNHDVMDGINAVRVEFRRVWFDRDKCKDGLEALRQYRADFDEKLNTFKDNPRKDWATHAADAFRYLIMAYRQPATPPPKKEPEPFRGPGTGMTVDELIRDVAPKRLRV
jgi:phage terminase large subunit